MIPEEPKKPVAYPKDDEQFICPDDSQEEYRA